VAGWPLRSEMGDRSRAVAEQRRDTSRAVAEQRRDTRSATLEQDIERTEREGRVAIPPGASRRQVPGRRSPRQREAQPQEQESGWVELARMLRMRWRSSLPQRKSIRGWMFCQMRVFLRPWGKSH